MGMREVKQGYYTHPMHMEFQYIFQPHQDNFKVLQDQILQLQFAKVLQ